MGLQSHPVCQIASYFSPKNDERRKQKGSLGMTFLLSKDNEDRHASLLFFIIFFIRIPHPNCKKTFFLNTAKKQSNHIN
jgi:hypothetical protein